MKYSDQEDIIKLAAKEADIPLEQMTKIVEDFWNTVRSYLTNPLSTKKGILINGFGAFFIKPFTVKKKLNTILRKNPTSKNVEINQKLLKQLEE